MIFCRNIFSTVKQSECWLYITEVCVRVCECVCVRACVCVLNKYIIQTFNLFTFSLRRNWEDMVLVQLPGSPTLVMRMARSLWVSWRQPRDRVWELWWSASSSGTQVSLHQKYSTSTVTVAETRAYAGCLHSGLTWTYALTYGTSCIVSVPVVPQTPTRCTECSCLATPSASSCLLSIYSRSYWLDCCLLIT